MNEELIRECAVLAARAWPNATRQFVADIAIRLYHARTVAPLVEAATEALRIAMEQSVKARAPECGAFGEIAQDLDAALAPFQQPDRAADNLKLANDAAAVLRESEQDRERLKQELAALRANVAPLVEALKPFALIAELDIGDDEADSDLFRPLTFNHAPHITVGRLRAALKALAAFQQEAK